MGRQYVGERASLGTESRCIGRSDEVARFEPNAHAHVMSKEQHLLPQACHGAIRMRQDVIMELGDESVSRQTTIVVEQEL